MGDWAAVARAVNERMQERGITQRELAERSGISPATLRQIQQGMDRQRSRATLAAISRALGFSEDHLRRVSMGGRASEPSGTDAPVLEGLRAELADLRQRVEDIETRLRQ
ncbi:XRE family transcriptional regulator [Actinomadura craniellae]|uniref:XRE family transcriptional regulator n=1 Tax=Actinomadura craniellae TaxID=2231787 RepID=A0A365HB56_9ACTN|nr:XRE family transcriptional regulator [Actinomadura craniellae]